MTCIPCILVSIIPLYMGVRGGTIVYNVKGMQGM